MTDATQALLPVTIPRELFDFLMGSGEIDGTSFGDLNDRLPGRFWWRALMRRAEANQAHSLPGDGMRAIVEEFCLAMEYAAGCDEGVDEDTAATEIMSWTGSPMAVAYTKARAALATEAE